MRHSHNPPLPHSQNIPPFIYSGAPRIYPFLPEYIPLFYNYMRRSQNLSRPTRVPPSLLDMRPSQNPPPPPFKHLYVTLPKSILRPKIYPLLNIYMRYSHDPPLPEYTSFYIKRRFQNLPLPSRIYPPF